MAAAAVCEEDDSAVGAEPWHGALTDEQELAVARRSEPLMLSAAAGSGKTSVLAERFARAVREDGLRPSQILALTFTERAAGELRARVRERLLELGDRAAARDTEAAFVGTFHGFCARLLRAHALAAAVEPGFAILDDGLAARLAEQAFAQALTGFVAREGAVDLLAAYSVERVRTIVLQAYAELRSRGQRRPRLPAANPRDDGAEEQAAARACVLLDQMLALFGDSYERAKRERAALDFDDLELLARELLLGNERVRAEWSERFALLMVDEFQDTNPRQLAILQALEHGNLFTVGDELQAIYGFRHADVELFRGRRERLAQRGGALKLTHNFRGRAPLLEVVNAAFAGRFQGYEPLVAGRAEECHDDARVELLLTDTRGWDPLAGSLAAGLPHAHPWRAAEARLLAARVSELVEAGEVRPGEVAVLARAGGDLQVFERALQQRGLRTLAAIGDFWARQQVRDLVAYLRALANPLDEEALYGALASPLAGCSLDSLALVARAARDARRPAWELTREAVAVAGLHGEERDRLVAFCAWLERERRELPRHTLAALLERALSLRGYEQHVLGLQWGARRLANVHKLLRVARRFEAADGRDLRAFLDHVAFLEAAGKAEPDAPVEGQDPDAVRLMTTHVAKGLEFGTVCVVDLGRQPNTQTPALLLDGERVGLRLVQLGGAGSTPALDYAELCEQRRRREAEEEDRILYVAMTRARERLLLSGSIDFARWPQACAAPPPIAWLAPALSEDLPARALAGEAGPFTIRVGGARRAAVSVRVSSPARGSAQLLPPQAAPPYEQQALWPAAEDTPRVEPAAPPSPQRLPEPGPAPAAISSLSYSSLTELERCGYRYYLERVLGLPEDRAAAARGSAAQPGLEPRARGTLIHRLMESFDFSHPQPPSAGAVNSAARELGLPVSGAESRQISELLGVAGGTPLTSRVAAARDVRREHPFAFALGSDEPLVSGVIDLLAEEGAGAYLVLDYKSDRVAPGSDLAALVERDYGAQRLLYALAVLRLRATSVEVVHWFLERPREPVGVLYRAAQREALERELAQRLGRARGRGFAVSESPHRELCASCPGRGRLCSWPESVAMRELPG
jgi:ATP-dependent exoDNAse (exonuclease V) beta subunit